MPSPADPLRVLVHVNHLELGGTQLNALDFAIAGREHGIDTLLVGARSTVPESGPSLVTLAGERGVPIELYDDVPRRLPNARTLNAIADRFAADLVHVYGSWGAGAGAAYWGPALAGRRPWVQTVYEMSVSPIIKRHMPLIVGTGYLVDDLRDRPGRTTLISPPVDLVTDRRDAEAGESFRRSIGVSGPLLVIVSRLDPNMKAFSIGVAIDAMRALAPRGATLVVVGGGDAEADLRARAEGVNAAVAREAVVFTGALVDPRAAYSAADIMLGMGGSAARSLAFGRPLVVQGEAGWSRLFDEKSAAALARASYWSPDAVADPVADLVAGISQILDDPQRRAELGTFGRTFAEERFGLEAMTARLADFYREAIRDYRLRDWLADLPREGDAVSERLARSVRGLGRRGRASTSAVAV